MENIIPNCIICNKKLQSALDEETKFNYNQPYGAVKFISYGYYGSTVWDPMDGRTRIEINICDLCIVAHKDNVVQCEILQVEPEINYSPWLP